jgi:molybdopterin synthase catalytic subunit
MTIANKDRFPHIHALELSGGEKSAKGEEYYENHEKELEKEFYEIMNNITERYKLGGLNVIHGINEKEK